MDERQYSFGNRPSAISPANTDTSAEDDDYDEDCYDRIRRCGTDRTGGVTTSIREDPTVLSGWGLKTITRSYKRVACDLPSIYKIRRDLMSAPRSLSSIVPQP